MQNAGSCYRYHKGTDFQANHNREVSYIQKRTVVIDTTKVQIFKQITTHLHALLQAFQLLQIPQRYRFSSKSQRDIKCVNDFSCCYRYHKGTDFQANHNYVCYLCKFFIVVIDTTKVQIFKQITTSELPMMLHNVLLQIPQRYRFSSKSQQYLGRYESGRGCYRYHKGTDFQANHNALL